jgi:DNA polymerase/3'-5' exonuclease PolX
MKMHLHQAKAYADKTAAWLEPYCERIVVAGSIRREMPVCNDIDLVLVPRLEVSRDFFGEVIGTKSLLHDFLSGYVKESKGSAEWLTGQDKPTGDNFILQLPKCQLDIWTASDANFGTRLLCRTGSMQHNIWLAEWARDLGGKWRSYDGVQIGLKTFPATTEEEVYESLGLPWVEPRNREVDYMQKNFRSLNLAAAQ